MSGPFPGMDPYLERHWRDVHTRLIAYTADAIQEQLPADLVARVEERVYDEVEEVATRAVYPDVQVVEDRTRRPAAGSAGAAGSVVEPIVLGLESEPVTERFVEIVDLEGNQVVTAIEFVSPSNKLPGPGRDTYLAKRQEFHASDTSIVEIDLVRAGDWLSMVRPYHVPARHRTTYRVVIRRAPARNRVELYPIALRQRLPIIPIPLRAGDPDATLDLQAMVDQAYRNGRYDRTDYRRACDPPLGPEDAGWVDALLREAGLR